MPDPFIYREVKALLTARIPDTADADENPDRVPLNGYGTAHPKFKGGSVVFTEQGEFAIPRDIPVRVVDGHLMVEVLDGEDVVLQPLYLPVTVDERANQNWSYQLTFGTLTIGERGDEITHPPLSFPVEAGDGPLEISTVATPVIKSSGFVTRGVPGAGLHEITAENGELVFQWDNGRTASVPVPEAVEGPPGPMVDVTAGTVEVGATPTDFDVSVTGEGETRQINFTLPKPEKGDKGDKGDKGEGIGVSVKDFGAVGDGVSDDRQSFVSWLDHLGNNGGRGVIPPGDYKISRRLRVTNPPMSYEIEGQTGGAGKPRLVFDSTTPTTALELIGLVNCRLSNFEVKGVSVAKPIVQGVSIVGGRGVVLEGIVVDNYTASGIMAYSVDELPPSRDLRVENCVTYGNEIASNGILLTSVLDSSIVNCKVYDLYEAGQPGYGIQFKNGSVRCQVIGGIVQNARVGIGFGNTSPADLTTNCRVFGVTVLACRNSLELGSATGCHVEVLADGGSDYTGGSVVSLAGADFTDNFVKVSAMNVRADSRVVFVQGSGNSIEVDRVKPALNSTLVEFDVGASNNIVKYNGLDHEYDGRVIDRSSAGGNVVRGI